MERLVRYKGSIDFLGISDGDVSKLHPDAMYNVVDVEFHGWYTLYHLKGFEGSFNSFLFDEVKSEQIEKGPTFWAVSQYTPIVGRRLEIVINKFNNLNLESPVPRIITVVDGHKIADKTYAVTDKNSNQYTVSIV